MTFVPSNNPVILKEQLKELLLISEQKLAELTAPVVLIPPEEIREIIKQVYGYAKGQGDYYQPPSSRFARMASYRTYFDTSSEG